MRIPLRFLALAALWSLGAIAVDAAAAAAAVEAGSTLRASVSAAGGARYIVQLSDAPLVAYRGGLPGLAATAPVQKVQDAWSATARPRVAGDAAAFARVRPDLFSPASFDYRAHLRQRQAAAEQAIQAIAPQARALYHYDVAFNGLTLRLSAAEAERVRALPGVLAVTAEERVVPLMDASLPVIGAPAAWTDPRVGGRSGGGRGVRIAVIDSGISAAHPMYADDGFVPPAGFPQASWTVGDAVTAYGAEDLARYTNDKVIVARTYANPEVYDPATP
ncbi:MAG: protease inhibitor I9 family protein [Ardenticatenia bacterium]|nr:protease inhibitor I9 family protein [Ardenticatenia bacterium]